MSDQILRNTQGDLQVTFYSGGSATSADDDVLVTVVNAAGSAVATSGTATAAGTASPGVYDYTLDPQADLDEFTLTWTGAFGGVTQSVETQVEIVGGFHVALADVRALSGLTDETKFTTARIQEVRRWWEELSESFCGVAFVPRFERCEHDGDGTTSLMLCNMHPRKLLSVTVDDTAVTDLTDWHLYDSGKLIRDDGGVFTADVCNVVIAYEYGYDSPPADLREAALVAIRYKLLGDKSGIPERAMSMTTDVGGYTLSIAGANRPTGIPEVDSALMRHQETGPLVR